MQAELIIVGAIVHDWQAKLLKPRAAFKHFPNHRCASLIYSPPDYATTAASSSENGDLVDEPVEIRTSCPNNDMKLLPDFVSLPHEVQLSTALGGVAAAKAARLQAPLQWAKQNSPVEL